MTGQGTPIPIASAQATFRSPTTDRSDLTVDLVAKTPTATGEVTLPDGLWVVEIVASTRDGTRWHDTRRIRVTGGEGR